MLHSSFPKGRHMTTKEQQEAQTANVQYELFRAFRNYTPEGVKMLLNSVRILHSDCHETDCRRLAEIITADIQHRFGG